MRKHKAKWKNQFGLKIGKWLRTAKNAADDGNSTVKSRPQ